MPKGSDGPARPGRSLTSTGNRTRPTVNTARAHVTARPRPGPAPRAARPRRPPIGGRAVVDHIRSGTTKPRAVVGRPRASLNARRALRKQSGACWELWSGRGRTAGRPGERELQVPAAPRGQGRTAPPRAAVGGAGRAP